MNETELAWAAGFYDGEGNVCWRKHQRGGYNLSISQKDREVLDRFARAVTLGRVTTQGKNGWQFYCGNRAGIIAIFRLLWPYLGTTKKVQAVKALSTKATLPDFMV